MTSYVDDDEDELLFHCSLANGERVSALLVSWSLQSVALWFTSFVWVSPSGITRISNKSAKTNDQKKKRGKRHTEVRGK